MDIIQFDMIRLPNEIIRYIRSYMSVCELLGLAHDFPDMLIQNLQEPRDPANGCAITNISYFRIKPASLHMIKYQHLHYRYSTEMCEMSFYIFRAEINTKLQTCCDLYITRFRVKNEFVWRKLFATYLKKIDYFDYIPRSISIGWTYPISIGFNNQNQSGELNIYRDILKIINNIPVK